MGISALTYGNVDRENDDETQENVDSKKKHDEPEGARGNLKCFDRHVFSMITSMLLDNLKPCHC